MRTVDQKVHVAGDGQVHSAIAEGRIDRTVAQVWSVIEAVDRYPGRIPMIHKVRLDGTHASLDLKFKITFFSVGVHFVVDVAKDKERSVELRYVSGEPRGIRLRFDVEPLDDGRACMLRSTGEVELMSLGWMAKYFLRHHPEIQYGVIPGIAVGLFESMRIAAEALPAA